MEKRVHLGDFEEILLLAVQALGEDAYGVTIRRAVEEVAGRRASIGAIYVTLDRLEAKGLISSYQGDPTPERGGRAKRYFRIEGAGVRVLEEAEAARQRLRAHPVRSWRRGEV